MIEFAIAITVLLTMIFGAMDFARAVYIYHFLPYAAGQATRYANVRGSSWGTATCSTIASVDCNATSANIKSYIQSIAPPGVNTATLTATATWPGTTPTGAACATGNGANSPNCVVKVVLTYPFTFVLPFLPATGPTFSATSVKLILE